ncbi:MAG TPA: type II toxin-antitoxin system RelE/ParE family toxin [Stellaceae bacterium]|nr:type II toxin-antitoxin system RelE/ParE family toxin [Stellaceae bacterium]
MPRLLFRPAARTDLIQISRYIQRQSGHKNIAADYVLRIRQWCEHLLVFPEAGRTRDDLRPGIRVVAFERRVVIAYTILPSGDVEIGRFFYGGRNYEAMIGSDLQR